MHVRRGNFASLVVTIFLPLLLLSLAAMPLFGQSTTIYSFGGGPGGYNSQAYNRRVEFSIRLSF